VVFNYPTEKRINGSFKRGETSLFAKKYQYLWKWEVWSFSESFLARFPVKNRAVYPTSANKIFKHER
jgi:hypothetical protein